MQKLVKRSVQAQRQAARRSGKISNREGSKARGQNIRTVKAANQEVRQNLKDARRARKEDWELGPIAPKRDLGFNEYGLYKDQFRSTHDTGTNSVNPEILEKRCAWAGGPRQLNLVPEDRVVILEGPDKGKIDRIKSVDIEHGVVTLQEHHKVCCISHPTQCCRILIKWPGSIPKFPPTD